MTFQDTNNARQRNGLKVIAWLLLACIFTMGFAIRSVEAAGPTAITNDDDGGKGKGSDDDDDDDGGNDDDDDGDGGNGNDDGLNPMPAWFISNDWISVSNYTLISNDSGNVDFTDCNITYTLNAGVSSLGKTGSSC